MSVEAVPVAHYFDMPSLGSVRANEDGMSFAGLRANADGTYLVYTSDAITSRPQVFVHPADTSDVAGDRQLTDVEGTIANISFSPTDPGRLIVASDHHGDERDQLALYDIRTTRKPRRLTDDEHRHSFGCWSPDGTSIAFTTSHKGAATCDIEIFDLAADRPRVLNRDNPLEGEFHASTFTPDGSYLLVQELVSWKNITRWWAYSTDPDATTPPVRLTPSDYDTLFDAPTWVPGTEADMLLVSELAGKDPDDPGMRELYHARVSRPLGQLALTKVVESSYDIDGLTLSPDGKQALVVTNEAGDSKVTLYDVTHNADEAPRLTPAAVQPPPLPIGTIRSIDWTEHNGVLVAHSTYAGQRLYTWDLQTTPEPFVQAESRVPLDALTEPRTMSYDSFDGTRIDCLVYEAPQDPENLEVRPAVFWIHGGPENDVGAGDWNPRIQALVNNGFTVIAFNMRGSTGRGKRFRMAANGVKRWGSLRDIDAGYDHVAAVMSDRIDPSKIALVGGSAGGIIVLGCLARRKRTRRPPYAAGVANSAVADLESFFEETSPERRGQRAKTYGDYRNPSILAFMRGISALRHANRITVPVRFVHGEQDRRVPISQPRRMLATLLGNGVVNAELKSYPDEGHGLKKRENRIDAIEGTIAFLKQVLG